MGKASRVQKEKTNKLEGELVLVKKENARLLCEKNKVLEENVKKLEEENSMLKKELSTLKQEKECLNVKLFVCDVSCDTNDLSDYGIKKYAFTKVVCKKECNDEHENCIDRTSSYYNDNIGLKIMKRMGFKGKGLGKHEQGIRNPIKPIARPKYEGLGYATDNGKMNKGSRESIESIKIVQYS